jgi:DCN1-like protein 1/2
VTFTLATLSLGVSKRSLETKPPFYLIADPMETDKITAEGVERFLNDLCLAPDSIKVLILAWKCKAAIQCEFTKDEFAIGLSDLGCVFS